MICQTLWIKELQRPFMIMFCQRLFPFFVVMQTERGSDCLISIKIWAVLGLILVLKRFSLVLVYFCPYGFIILKFLLKALWIFVSFVLKTAEIYSSPSGIYVLSFLASHLKTASKFGNVWRSRVAVFEVNSFL